MKKIISILLIIFLIILTGMPLASAYIYNKHPCPVCEVEGLNTYQSKYEWGHLFYLYKCYNNHYWWERAN
jgi:uncharacterized protein YpmB